MTANAPDMWQEVFMFSVQPLDGVAIEFAAITEDISSFPDLTKDIEGKAMANGGRRASWSTQPDLEYTFKIIPIDSKLGANGMTQIFNPQDEEDNSDPIKVLGTRNRTPVQGILTWAEDLSVYTTAGQATTADKQALRQTFKNAYCTKLQFSSDDKNISAEVTFKLPPFNKTGLANYKEESTESTAIPVATSYTTAVKNSAM